MYSQTTRELYTSTHLNTPHTNTPQNKTPRMTSTKNKTTKNQQQPTSISNLFQLIMPAPDDLPLVRRHVVDAFRFNRIPERRERAFEIRHEIITGKIKVKMSPDYATRGVHSPLLSRWRSGLHKMCLMPHTQFLVYGRP